MAVRLRNPLAARAGQLLVAVAGLGVFTWCFWLFDSPLSLFLGMYAVFGVLVALLVVMARTGELDDGGPDFEQDREADLASGLDAGPEPDRESGPGSGP